MIDISSLVKADLQTITPSMIRRINNRFSQIPNIVNLTIGEPDFPTPDHIKLAAVRSILNNHTHYAPNRGTADLLNAISSYLASRFGLDYDPNTQIVVTNGAVPVTVDVSKTSFKLTPKVLKATLEKYGQHLKLVVLNYPNNPTGVTYSENEVRELANVLRHYPVAVLSDEVYSELAYSGEHVSIARYLPEQTLLVNSVSKSYAMTGWRIGYLCGDPGIIRQLAKVHQAAVATVGTPNMDAATEAFLFGAPDSRHMKAVYQKRRDFLTRALTEIGFDFVPPQGAFYVYVHVPKFFKGNAMAFVEELATKAGVAVVPGEAFTGGHSNYFRMSYATSMANLDLAVSRLQAFVSHQFVEIERE